MIYDHGNVMPRCKIVDAHSGELLTGVLWVDTESNQFAEDVRGADGQRCTLTACGKYLAIRVRDAHSIDIEMHPDFDLPQQFTIRPVA